MLYVNTANNKILGEFYTVQVIGTDCDVYYWKYISRYRYDQSIEYKGTAISFA